MDNSYRIEPDPAPATDPASGPSRRLTTALWALIAMGAGLNALTSLAGANVLVSAAIGLVTVACIVWLVAHQLKHRG